MTVNESLSPEAEAFIKKIYRCEPPCDSFGVCGPCLDIVNFKTGYNFGCKYQREQDAKICDSITESLSGFIGHENTEHVLSADCARAIRAHSCDDSEPEES